MRSFRFAAMTLAAAGVIMALSLSASAPPAAQAAPCPAPTFSGNLTIAGTPPCDVESEIFNVYCSAGNVFVDYGVNDNLQGPVDSGVACSAPTQITVDGYIGGDRIDLSRVSAAGGFTGINQPNVLFGSFGNDILIGSPLPDSASGSIGSDILLMRDGVADTVDCGADLDFAQVDQQGTDSVTGCEFIDFLPTPLAATAAPVTTTKKCKKKHRSAVAAKKKRCKKKR
jgi:hypothetical protein